MAAKSDQTLAKTCNRIPFQSDSGCDRGSVDIRQFADFPFCDPIDPTEPQVPPEVVDSPLNIPVPPPCACVNMQYKVDLKYSEKKKFETSASFTAKSDCCEGNYDVNLNLRIPCPISENKSGDGKIKVGISYGPKFKSDSASFIKADSSSCTIEPLSPEIKLQIPCPIKGNYANDKKLKIAIGYGDGFKPGEASFIKADSKDCTIQPLSPNINLQIPCPVKNDGESAGRIRVRIGFKNKFSSASASFMDVDSSSCTVKALSPNLFLRIPCPFEKPKGDNAGKIRVSIGYSTGDAFDTASASFLGIDSSSCTLNPLFPNIRLQIPCPISKPMLDFVGSVAYADNSTGAVEINEGEASGVSSPCKRKVIVKVTFPLRGGGGGGSGALANADPDNVSEELRTGDRKLQIKSWNDATPPNASTTIVQDITGSSDATDTVVARQSDKALKYKKPGRIISASDARVVFTQAANGNVVIGVYYV